MIPRRRTIMVCAFCGYHYQEKESAEHGEHCEFNPNLKGCGTCRRNECNKCELGLIPIDFKKKRKTGRQCLAWEPKDDSKSIRRDTKT